MEELKRPWIKLPVAVLQSDLSRSAVIVFALLLDRVNNSGVCEMPISYIVRYGGVSARTAARALAELCQKGFVYDEVRVGKPTIYAVSSVYTTPKYKGGESK